MRKYDLTILVGAKVSEEAQDKLVEKVEAEVAAVGGKAGKMTDMGKKQLAYPINKITQALYLSWSLELPPPAVVQLARKLNIAKDVIRHLLVKVED